MADGTIKKCTVRPQGESHVEISYRLADGETMHHAVECYLEPGYRGRVDVEIRDITFSGSGSGDVLLRTSRTFVQRYTIW